MFTPNCVAFEEIVQGVDLGLNINLDNLSVLGKFGEKYGNGYPCGIRLNPHILAGGNLKISTGHSTSKFGISIQQLPDIIQLVERYKIMVNGLHIHTGSEITEIDVFLKMAEILFGAARNFPSLKSIDFGGGFKVAYKKNDPITNVDQLGAKLSKLFSDFEQQHGPIWDHVAMVLTGLSFDQLQGIDGYQILDLKRERTIHDSQATVAA